MASQANNEDLPEIEDKDYTDQALTVVALVLGPILVLYFGFVCIYRCFRRKRKAAEKEQIKKTFETAQTERTAATLHTDADLIAEKNTGRKGGEDKLGIQLAQMYENDNKGIDIANLQVQP